MKGVDMRKIGNIIGNFFLDLKDGFRFLRILWRESKDADTEGRERE